MYLYDYGGISKVSPEIQNDLFITSKNKKKGITWKNENYDPILF